MLQATVATVSSRALLAACDQLGLDRQALLDAARLTAADVADADGRLAVAQVAALWQAALDACRDPSLGLRIALAVPFGAYRVVDFLAASAPTVGEGLVRRPILPDRQLGALVDDRGRRQGRAGSVGASAGAWWASKGLR